MVEVRNEINKQLLEVLKDVDDKAKPVREQLDLLNQVAQIHSIVNK